jgi:hypothetical protein
MSENESKELELVSGLKMPVDALADEDIRDIRFKLWKLLGKRTECFTMGDSSSVPVETAQELMESISFTIGLYMKSKGGDPALLLRTADLQELLKAGWTEIEAQLKTGKELLQKVRETAPSVENRSYKDTLKGIEVFFKKYDYRFFAHEIPGDIDYQLCHPLPGELQGIEYINGYLRRLLTENRFCGCFAPERIVPLLRSYCSDYRGLLINLYEPVAVNALGLAMLDGDILSLEIGDDGRSKLLAFFKSNSREDVLEALKLSADKLYRSLQLEDNTVSEYLLRTASDLYWRINAALPSECLDGIFLSLPAEETEEAPEVLFIDGEAMDNERLRKFIDEIGDCRYVSDKIAMVKQDIHSMKDLIEVLNIGFWGEECITLFDTLGDPEIGLLLQFVRSHPPEWRSDSGWEQQLMKYTRHS